jgi:hypothetical protein
LTQPRIGCEVTFEVADNLRRSLNDLPSAILAEVQLPFDNAFEALAGKQVAQ